jgi:hypothetical protein
MAVDVGLDWAQPPAISATWCTANVPTPVLFMGCGFNGKSLSLLARWWALRGGHLTHPSKDMTVHIVILFDKNHQ